MLYGRRFASMLSVSLVCLCCSAERDALAQASDDSAAPSVSSEQGGKKSSRLLGRLLPGKSVASDKGKRAVSSVAVKVPPAADGLDSACPEGLGGGEKNPLNLRVTQSQTRILLSSPITKNPAKLKADVLPSGTKVDAVVMQSSSVSVYPDAVSVAETTVAVPSLSVNVNNVSVVVDNLCTVLSGTTVEKTVVEDQLNRLRAEIALMRRQKSNLSVDVWIRLDVLIGRLEQGIAFVERGIDDKPDENMLRLGMERLRTIRESLRLLVAS